MRRWGPTSEKKPLSPENESDIPSLGFPHLWQRDQLSFRTQRLQATNEYFFRFNDSPLLCHLIAAPLWTEWPHKNLVSDRTQQQRSWNSTSIPIIQQYDLVSSEHENADGELQAFRKPNNGCQSNFKRRKLLVLLASDGLVSLSATRFRIQSCH